MNAAAVEPHAAAAATRRPRAARHASACARAGCAPRSRRSGSRSASPRSSPCSASPPPVRPGCSPRSTSSAPTCSTSPPARTSAARACRCRSRRPGMIAPHRPGLRRRLHRHARQRQRLPQPADPVGQHQRAERPAPPASTCPARSAPPSRRAASSTPRPRPSRSACSAPPPRSGSASTASSPASGSGSAACGSTSPASSTPPSLAPEIDDSVLIGFPAAKTYLGYTSVRRRPSRGRQPDRDLRPRRRPSQVNAVYNVLAATANPENPSEVNVSQPSDDAGRRGRRQGRLQRPVPRPRRDRAAGRRDRRRQHHDHQRARTPLGDRPAPRARRDQGPDPHAVPRPRRSSSRCSAAPPASAPARSRPRSTPTPSTGRPSSPPSPGAAASAPRSLIGAIAGLAARDPRRPPLSHRRAPDRMNRPTHQAARDVPHRRRRTRTSSTGSPAYAASCR